MSDEVRAGVLLVLKSSGLGKRYQKKYASLHKKSSHGISRFEVFESKDAYEKKGKKHIIPLDNCATIDRVQDGKKNDKIKLTFNDDKEQTFQTETDADRELWYAALSSVIFGGGSLTSNVIYQQYEEEGYDVVVKENDIAKRLKLQGMYRLIVTEQNIELRDKAKKKLAATWPLMLLRKYGRDKQEFSLEAGRRCQTGPGMFYFITDHYNEIFQEVDTKVRNLAERNRASSISSAKKSPISMNPPESPLPTSPVPPSPFTTEAEYDNPRDQVKFPRQATTEQEPVYNEPVNAQPSFKKRKDKKNLAGPPKPPRESPKKVGKKKKGKEPKNPDVVEEATYSQALNVTPVDANGGAYGTLDFEGKRASNISSGDDNQYDSLDMGRLGGDQVIESEYSTTQTFSNMGINEDCVYDHVKH